MTVERRQPKGLVFSPAPHIHSGESVAWINLTIIAALVPVMVFSVMGYGWHAARVMGVAVSSAVSFEWLIEKVFGKPVRVYDCSAVVTGLVFSLLLPPSVPWWLVVTGSFVSILVGRQIFGGNGGSPFNPALVGWASVRLSWNSHIDYDLAFINYDLKFPVEYPLSVLKQSGASALGEYKGMSLFMGSQTGGIGTAAIFLLLIGGIILLARGVINWRVPVFFIGGVALTALVFYLSDSGKYASPLFHILTGSVVFGAFFLAPDHSSSPVNGIAMSIFGAGCGIFTVLFRVWSIYPDGVVFAILIMNILNPILDYIRPKFLVKVRSEVNS